MQVSLTRQPMSSRSKIRVEGTTLGRGRRPLLPSLLMHPDQICLQSLRTICR